MKNKKIILLVVLVTAIGVYAFWVSQPKAGDDKIIKISPEAMMIN